MDENRISPQQELDHPDSGEGADPVPIGVSLLVGCMMLFGTSYIFSEDQSPPEKGSTFNGAMPAFKDQLKDDEIAAIATHLRSQWGNSAPAVTADVVVKTRADTSVRAEPWKGDADLAAMK